MFEGTFSGHPVVIKERFPKHYRHPVLDEKLTRKRLVSVRLCPIVDHVELGWRVNTRSSLSRLLTSTAPSPLHQEARCLLRCRKAGLRVPCPYFVDEKTSTLYLQRIDGHTIRTVFNSGATSGGASATVVTPAIACAELLVRISGGDLGLPVGPLALHGLWWRSLL